MDYRLVHLQSWLLVCWCVALQDDSEIIGVSGVRVIEWSGRHVLNLYYRFVPSAWGKGYAVEVGQEAMRVAETYFSHMPIVVRTRPTNKSAMRVAEKLSLTRFTNLDTPEHVVYASWW
ncbi:GNAT family N-acetyltransferase [Alicyclobacillus sendaiensis]|uniref:GNAT family N-acetyltransferase n=1 Tax=Alicyclobacillus sendaiensis TaxID=192387 RepID=UPI003D25B825